MHTYQIRFHDDTQTNIVARTEIEARQLADELYPDHQVVDVQEIEEP